MAVPPVIARAGTSRGRTATPRAARATTRPGAPEVDGQSPPPQAELDTVTARWQLALDAAGRALGAPGNLLPPSELARRRNELARERRQTAELLRRLAVVTRVRPEPWLSPVPLSTTMLGLPATVRACLFDLEGVLTDSAVLHALAWGEVFDDFLLRLADKTGWQFIPFDRDFDYRAYLDGRPRLEGVHAFLDSRGIRLPEGRLRRSGRCRHRRRPGQAEGRRARPPPASARCDRPRGSAPIPRGRRSSRVGPGRRVRRARARCRCSSSPGWRRSSRSVSTPTSSAPRGYVPVPPRISCSSPAAASASAPRTRSPSRTAPPGSRRGMRPGSL